MSESVRGLDVAEIDSVYKVLGAFLVVTESIALTWLIQADPEDKPLAGLSAVSLLALFLGAFYAVQRSQNRVLTVGVGSGAVIVGQHESTVHSPDREPSEGRVGIPDQWFTIAAPPSGWEVLELSARDFVVSELGTDDKDVIDAALGGSAGRASVLVIRSPSVLTFVPVPGQTTIFGRAWPTALAVECRLQLVIVPLAHAQPPLYVDRSLDENFLRALSPVMNVGVLRLVEITQGTGKSGRRQWLARFEQQLHGVRVEGRDRPVDVRIEKLVFGIAGAVQDYALRLDYVVLDGDEGQVLGDALATLRALAESFETLKPVNVERSLADMRERADSAFEKRVNEFAATAFDHELMLAILRFRGRDLNDVRVLGEAVGRLTPFDAWRKTDMISDVDDEVMALLDTLELARAGNLAPLRDALLEAIEVLYEEPVSGADTGTPAT